MPRKNKEGYNRYMKEYMLRRYHARRREAFERLGNRCAECGGTGGLEIDHIDPSLKSFPVSKMWSVREEVFWEEVEKCQLLCREHHVAKTIRDRGFNSRDQHGTYVCYRHGKCRCDKCRKASRDQSRRCREKKRTVSRVAKGF